MRIRSPDRFFYLRSLKMIKTALCFADDNSNNSNNINHSIDLNPQVGFDCNANVNSIFATQAYRRTKGICRELAMDDPARILKGIASLPVRDQISLAYLRNRALRMLEIARRNNPGNR